MKKILALILSVLMIATAFCAVIPASATVDIDTIVNRHNYYVGTANQASDHDITDGAISEGEYTFSTTLKNNTLVTNQYLADKDTNGGNFIENAVKAGTDEITLHMGHDETNIYIAIESADAETAKKYPYGIQITRPDATTYGEMADRITLWLNNSADSDYFASGNPEKVGSYSYKRYVDINEDGTRKSITMPSAVVQDTSYESYITLNGETGLLEFRITKAAIKTCFGVETFDEIGLVVAHKIDGGNNDNHTFAYYVSSVLSDAQRTALDEAYSLDAAIVPTFAPYVMNLVDGVNVDPDEPDEPVEPETPKTLAEIVNFRNYYVGGQIATAPDVTDGVISAGEYTFAQTLATSDVTTETYLRDAVDTVTGRDATDNIKLYMASDADYIYMAMESRQVIGNDASNKNFFAVALSRPNPTTYAEMMQRLHFRMTCTPAVGGNPVACTFAYNTVSDISADGSRTSVKWVDKGLTTPVTAYATLTSDYTGITEMKISKAELATALGCDASVFDDGVGLGFQHMIFNYKSSGVPFDSTLPYGEVACKYVQVLTSEQKAAIMGSDLALLTVNNWAPFMMNFSDAKVNTLNSASVRISSADNTTGLRFKTVFNKAEVAALTAGKDFTVGTIIVPADTLNGTAVTHEALTAADIKFLDVPATYDNPFASDANTVTIAGSIVGIKETNLDRDFTAIGYICVDGTYYYSDSATTTRNVKTIATIALGDLKAVKTAEYAHLVSEGVYSPYTEAQRVVLSKLNGTYEG